MRNRKAWTEAAQRILWTDREVLLHHLLEHRDCGVFTAVEQMCADAGWTLDSYIIAAVFDSRELIVEVTE